MKYIVNAIYRSKLVLSCLFFLRDKIYPILALPLVLLVRIISPIILIRTEPTYAMRIGHFTENIEMYLCEKDNGLHSNSYDIFFNSFKVSNDQIKKMWGRHPGIRISWFGMLIFYANRFYPNSGKYEVKTVPRDLKDIFEKSVNHIKLTQNEELTALESLTELGIEHNSSIVGMIARDSSYLTSFLPKINFGKRHDYRNSNIENYLLAAKFLSNKGYYVLRMGSKVEKKIIPNDSKIVDYASSNCRSDLNDVYISEKCKFFISGNTGLDSLPIIYRKPIVFVNNAPLQLIRGWYSNSLVIFKRHWLVKEKRFMKFKEIIESGAGYFYHLDDFLNHGIELIENSPEEISEVVIEMDKRLDGTWEDSDEDELMQKKFWDLFPIDNENKVFRCRIGRNYLRENANLI